MAFPTSPAVNDTYTTGGRVYRWTGYAWDFAESVSPHAGTHAAGGSDAVAISASQVSGLSAVATSGAYSDLSGRPTSFTTDGGTYTGQQSLTYTLQPTSVTVNQAINYASLTATAVAMPQLQMGQYSQIAYGNGLFLAPIGRDGFVAVSSDGLTWRKVSAPNNVYDCVDLVYGNGLWVMLLDTTTSIVGDNQFGASATRLNKQTVAVSSTNAASWTLQTLPVSGYWSLAYGNGRFVAVGRGIDQSRNELPSAVALYSTDGVSWTTASLPSSQYWYSVAWDATHNVFVAVSADGSGQVATSPDGITWTARTIQSERRWFVVACGGGLCVALEPGTSCNAVSSDGGASWSVYCGMPSSPVSGGPLDWRDVTYGSGLFVAVPGAAYTQDSSVAAISTNGQTWYAVTLPDKKTWRSVAYGNGRFVAVGDLTPSSNVTNRAAVIDLNDASASANATFTAAATTSYGVVPALTWQRSLDNGSTWSALPITGGTLTLSGLRITDNGNQYRAVATAYGAPIVASNAATLTIS